MNLAVVLRVAAWVLLLGLIFVTLGPIELRPISPLPVQVERASAVALIGFVFALAYPRQIVLVSLLVLGATVLLEALQLVSPSRHGRIADLAVKLFGGGAGLLVGHFVNKRRAARLSISSLPATTRDDGSVR